MLAAAILAEQGRRSPALSPLARFLMMHKTALRQQLLAFPTRRYAPHHCHFRTKNLSRALWHQSHIAPSLRQ